MLDKDTQLYLLNAFICSGDIASIEGTTNSNVVQKLKRSEIEYQNLGKTLLFFKSDVHQIYNSVEDYNVDKELAKKETLTLQERAQALNKSISSIRSASKRDVFISKKFGLNHLITLTSLLDFYIPSYSTRTDKMLSPLVAEYLEHHSNDVYAILSNDYRLIVTSNNEDLDKALYALYLNKHINESLTYIDRMQDLKNVITNWLNECKLLEYERIFNR